MGNITLKDVKRTDRERKAIKATIADTRHRLRQLYYRTMVDVMRQYPDITVEDFIETVESRIYAHESEYGYLTPLLDI